MSRRSDPVTQEVAAIIVRRDRAEMERALGRVPLGPVCLAPVIDPAEWGKCWGRTTFDHIKPEPRMGVRARSTPEELACLCQGHTEDGMKAGYQWNTAHRPELRAQLVASTHRCARCDAVVVGRACGFCGLERPRTGATRTGGMRRGC